MIAKMKKYTFLVYYKDHHSFLHKLRDLGVVHVIEKKRGNVDESSELYNWLNNRKRLTDAIKALSLFKKDHNIETLDQANNSDGINLLNEIESLFSERDQINHRKNVAKKDLERIEPWGYFDIENIHRLESENLYMHFHIISESKFNEEWIEKYNAIKIQNIGSSLYFVTITKDSSFPDIESEHIKTFENSRSSLESEISALDDELNLINEQIKIFIQKNLNTLIKTENRIDDHINWENVILNSESKADNKLVLLEGYVPVEEEETTNIALEQEDVYFEASAVTSEDNPPILLKNNKFARLFEVISNLYDRPSYNGFDLTAFYAPFYVIFFGLCVGDCGYGLLYLVISFFLKKSKNTFMKSVSNLVFWLGIGTVIFGFVSGVFFGTKLYNIEWAWFQPLKNVMLDDSQMFYFALILGAIQLTYAMIINIVTTTMRFGFIKALDTLGWVITIWGLAIVFYFSSTEAIPANFKMPLLIIILVVGGSMMLLFNKPEAGIKGIPISIGSGLWGLYNKVTGLLGDLLSYIRLFALGISGAVLGLVFNQLAFSFAPDIIILKQLVIIAILLFGHAVNIFLCSLSAFVHPMRLTFVEFYNNAGFEGGGKKYEPFRKKSSEVVS